MGVQDDFSIESSNGGEFPRFTHRPVVHLLVTGVDAMSWTTAKITVLVVDDHHGIRLALRTVLEEAGYLVAESSDADNLDEKIGECGASLVLLDVALEDSNGLDALRELRCISALSVR